jgi:hypothetical protein
MKDTVNVSGRYYAYAEGGEAASTTYVYDFITHSWESSTGNYVPGLDGLDFIMSSNRMSSLHLLRNFSHRYPAAPSGEERRTAYLMINSFHMFLPDNDDRTSYSDFLSKNPVQPFIESRASLQKWTDKCVLECCRNDSDVVREFKEKEEKREERARRQIIILSVLVCGVAVVLGAEKASGW